MRSLKDVVDSLNFDEVTQRCPWKAESARGEFHESLEDVPVPCASTKLNKKGLSQFDIYKMAVGDSLQLGRIKLGLFQESLLHGDLRFDVGCNEALRSTVMHRGCTLNDGDDLVAVSEGSTLRLEDDCGSTF